jgi:hypothetical protein
VFFFHEILSIYLLLLLYRTQLYVQWYGGNAVVQHSSLTVKVRKTVSSLFVGRNTVVTGSETFEKTGACAMGLSNVSED